MFYFSEVSRKLFLPLILGGVGLLLGLIWTVGLLDQEREQPVGENSSEEGEEVGGGYQKTMAARLNEIQIRMLDVKNVTLDEALERCWNAYSDQDHGLGIKFVSRYPQESSNDDSFDGIFNPDKISKVPNPFYDEIDGFRARDIGFADALDRICREGGVSWWIDEFAVVIAPQKPKEEQKRPSVIDPDDPFAGE